MNIAFIGLGNMGGPMTANLLKHDHIVKVFDLSKAAMSALEAIGAVACSTAQEAVKNVDVVVSMLPAGQHVESLYLDEKSGLIDTLQSGTLVIDSSTIDSVTSQKVAKALAAKSIGFVDAPVSGGVSGAQAGTLTFIVGGTESDFAAAQTVLRDMGKNIFHAGAVGAGQVAKICNNMLLSVLMLGTSEALQMAMANGLDPKVMSEIMLQSSGRNWTLEVYNPCPGIMPNAPSSNNYNGGFMVDLMRKDLALALNTAAISDSNTPMANLALNLYEKHSALGNGQRDFSSIFEMFSQK